MNFHVSAIINAYRLASIGLVGNGINVYLVRIFSPVALTDWLRSDLLETLLRSCHLLLIFQRFYRLASIGFVGTVITTVGY